MEQNELEARMNALEGRMSGHQRELVRLRRDMNTNFARLLNIIHYDTRMEEAREKRLDAALEVTRIVGDAVNVRLTDHSQRLEDLEAWRRELEEDEDT